MDTTNPYASPTTSEAAIVSVKTGVLGALATARVLLAQHFAIILTVVAVVWGPLELFSSYLDYHVFDPDDFRTSFRLAQFLDLFFGSVVTAAVISVGLRAGAGESPGFFAVFADGLLAWPRMWWTRFVSALTIVICLLLLVFPGIYVAVRLCFAESVAVAERVSGLAAMNRSFELTRGHWWFAFRLTAATYLLLALLAVIAMVPTVAVPALDHWIADAASQLVVDVVAAYATLCFFCGYRGLLGDSVGRMDPAVGLAEIE